MLTTEEFQTGTIKWTKVSLIRRKITLVGAISMDIVQLIFSWYCHSERLLMWPYSVLLIEFNQHEQSEVKPSSRNCRSGFTSCSLVHLTVSLHRAQQSFVHWRSLACLTLSVRIHTQSQAVKMILVELSSTNLCLFKKSTALTCHVQNRQEQQNNEIGSEWFVYPKVWTINVITHLPLKSSNNPLIIKPLQSGWLNIRLWSARTINFHLIFPRKPTAKQMPVQRPHHPALKCASWTLPFLQNVSDHWNSNRNPLATRATPGWNSTRVARKVTELLSVSASLPLPRQQNPVTGLRELSEFTRSACFYDE